LPPASLQQVPHSSPQHAAQPALQQSSQALQLPVQPSHPQASPQQQAAGVGAGTAAVVGAPAPAARMLPTAMTRTEPNVKMDLVM
jgi:hypothetical protein